MNKKNKKNRHKLCSSPPCRGDLACTKHQKVSSVDGWKCCAEKNCSTWFLSNESYFCFSHRAKLTRRLPVANNNYPTTLSLCRHWQEEVKLLNGTILASAWFDKPRAWEEPEKELKVVDLGFYLDDLWAGDGPMTSPGLSIDWASQTEDNAKDTVLYPCADKCAPADLQEFRRAIHWLLSKIDEGSVVEVGCLGGHGRTGLVLASLLVCQGAETAEAMKKVREDYCSEAIESSEQVIFLHRLQDVEAGKPDPILARTATESTHTTTKSEDEASDWETWKRLNTVLSEDAINAILDNQDWDNAGTGVKSYKEQTSPPTCPVSLRLCEYGLACCDDNDCLDLITSED